LHIIDINFNFRDLNFELASQLLSLIIKTAIVVVIVFVLFKW